VLLLVHVGYTTFLQNVVYPMSVIAKPERGSHEIEPGCSAIGGKKEAFT